MKPPCGALHLTEQDTILRAIRRITGRILKEARLVDMAPLVYLRNSFECQDGRSTEHVGLGIRALLLNDAEEIKRYEDDISVKGAFVRGFPSSGNPSATCTANLLRFLTWGKDKNYDTYSNEIDTQHEVLWRYQLHQSVVNPILVCLSRLCGAISIPKLKENDLYTT